MHVEENNFIVEHFSQHQVVVAQSLQQLHEVVHQTADVLVKALRDGHKVVAFGNGGSATQASHLVGELVGRFHLNRQPLPAIGLVSDPGVVTCIANDFGYKTLFERQSTALVNRGDVAIGLSTSGRSENVLLGLDAARRKGAITMMLTGNATVNADVADYVVAVPSASTACIQELHLMIIHIWCQYIDEAFREP